MLINSKGETIEDGAWCSVGSWDDPSECRDIIATVEDVEAHADRLKQRNGRFALHLKSDQTPEDVKDWISQADMIELDFPKFADGRAYSTARLLKSRYGFRGELRATGDVLPDQISYMARCGFDSFDLSRARDAEVIKTALTEMRHVYQTSGDERPAIWKQRQATNAPARTPERQTS